MLYFSFHTHFNLSIADFTYSSCISAYKKRLLQLLIYHHKKNIFATNTPCYNLLNIKVMKASRSCLTSVFFLFYSLYAAATTPAPDFISLSGKQWKLLTNPLKNVHELRENIEKCLPENRMISTANLDGYTTHWTIKDNQLYLVKIEAEVHGRKIFVTDDLKTIFSRYYTAEGIHAKWVNEELRAGKGKCIGAFCMNYEEECFISIKNGIVVQQKSYQNYVRHGMTHQRIYSEIKKRFPYQKFPELKGKKVCLYLDNAKIHIQNGRLNDCLARLYFYKERKYIEDQNHPIIKILKNILLSIYPWGITYINGIYRLEVDRITISSKEQHS